MARFIAEYNGVPIPVSQVSSQEEADAAVNKHFEGNDEAFRAFISSEEYRTNIQAAVKDANSLAELSSLSAGDRFLAGVKDKAKAIGQDALLAAEISIGAGTNTLLALSTDDRDIGTDFASSLIDPLQERLNEGRDEFQRFDERQVGIEDIGQNIDLIGAGFGLANSARRSITDKLRKVEDPSKIPLIGGLLSVLGRNVPKGKKENFAKNAKEVLKDTDIGDVVSKATTKEAADNATILANAPTPEAAGQAVVSARRAKQIEAFKRIKREEDLINDIRTNRPVNNTVGPRVEPEVIPPPPGFQVPGGATQATLPFGQAVQGTKKALPRFRANADGTFTEL